ncbi:glycosyltransferase family 2 protein [Verrucomicrobium spinosum]|uniref:glycosyltransferase family 2 protein n=1 Tax=Verrucomicrobium spinosum TaxID=2736 RepID=UPI0009468318|nr:glycosyltransferase family 2 protein [Verrucomicrobium spinosum]
MNPSLQSSAPIRVVLPAYNEEKDLPRLLDRLQASLNAMGRQYEIIVVDDGSRDRTAEIAEAAAGRMPVRLVQHTVNQGLGRAMQTGLSVAADLGGVVVTMDADNSHDPCYISEMVAVLERESMGVVIASRFRPGSLVQGVPWHRRMLSWGCFLAMKLVLPYKGVRDYSTGFRAYSPEAIKALVEKYGDRLVEVSGFACMVEILAKLRTVGTPAKEIPYILRYDEKQGVSKLRIIRTLRQYGSVVGRFWMQVPAGAWQRSLLLMVADV